MQQNGKFLLLTINEFSAWLTGLTVARKIKLIQNHHTWLPDYSTFNKKPNNHFGLLASMEKSHQERGFNEIAQNLTTFPDGTIAVCRSFEKMPAGIKGANQFGICIEHVGNFDAGKNVMTKAHRDTIVKVNAQLCKKFKLPIDTNSVVYHHWYDLTTGKRVKDGSPNTKTCPGTNFLGGNTIEACVKNFLPEVKKV
ncbi:MAG: N-acetylmuramoyl-L-alanine amidase [Bacteroidota bacterium]